MGLGGADCGWVGLSGIKDALCGMLCGVGFNVV